MSAASPRGVHLVGSAPFDSAGEAFQTYVTRLGSHLKSVPDGEVNERKNWVACQMETFSHVPEVINPFWGRAKLPSKYNADNQIASEHIPELLGNLETQYDKWALHSYEVFVRMRDEGKVPQNVKFQVGLPTPLNVLFIMIAPPYREAIEPIYEAAQARALRNIQDNIPHKDLLIQYEITLEFGLLEDVPHQKDNVYGWGKEMLPWFENMQQGIFDRILNVLGHNRIDSDVAVGVHLCYGDSMNEHFVQPQDTGILTDVAQLLLTKLERKLAYIHMPVPKQRFDEAYFRPLARILPLLTQRDTRLYLGLVHANDEAGTQQRIDAAKHVLGSAVWGVATECGLARTPKEDMESIFETLALFSSPERR